MLELSLLVAKVAETDDLERREALLQAIANGSVVSWQHINLLGEYDFSDDKLEDSVGNQAPKIGCLNCAENWGRHVGIIPLRITTALARPKFAFPPEEIEALLAMLLRKGETFRPEESPVVSPDPADTKFLHCAQASRVDFIVTWQQARIPDAPYGSTRVVSAGELLDRITLEM